MPLATQIYVDGRILHGSSIEQYCYARLEYRIIACISLKVNLRPALDLIRLL